MIGWAVCLNVTIAVRAVRELVHCACEMAERAPGDHVTFGEFAVLVAELRQLYRRQRSVINISTYHMQPYYTYSARRSYLSFMFDILCRIMHAPSALWYRWFFASNSIERVDELLILVVPTDFAGAMLRGPGCRPPIQKSGSPMSPQMQCQMVALCKVCARH